MTGAAILSRIDQAYLKVDSTMSVAGFRRAVEESLEHGFRSLCLPPVLAGTAKKNFPALRVAAVIGYPLGLETLAVLCFIGMFLINNIRRPINVGVISDQISSRIMASGLSAESQLASIFTAIFAPLLGYLIDIYGLGNGLSMLGLIMFLVFFPVRVLDEVPEGAS